MWKIQYIFEEWDKYPSRLESKDYSRDSVFYVPYVSLRSSKDKSREWLHILDNHTWGKNSTGNVISRIKQMDGC